jgi:hypothetical protein
VGNSDRQILKALQFREPLALPISAGILDEHGHEIFGAREDEHIRLSPSWYLGRPLSVRRVIAGSERLQPQSERAVARAGIVTQRELGTEAGAAGADRGCDFRCR